MSKRKKLNRLTGLVPSQQYENYNPLLEEDNRMGRRFGLGLIASVGLNLLILGGAGVMASRLPIAKVDDLPPIELFQAPPVEAAKPTPPPPPQVAQATPPPPVQRDPERIPPPPDRT
ncbi:MAG: hypothetical protein H7Z41_18015, partial [Cytophagales bacterium]|nr:hypothetical protein [Armatimonadota bacterium]